MNQSITYSCTALQGLNKKGVLKPDESGYYTVVLGALDIHNSAGQFYPFEAAKHIFDSSSSFMRRIQRGALRGECGHPRKLPGQSDREFINRVMDIYEPNVSHHIKEVTIERSKVKDNKGNYVIAIIGKILPADNDKGRALKAALENPDENVCFSIRSLTDDIITNTSWTKNIRTCITFDWVNEPGIHVATKYHSPALESLDLGVEEFIRASQVAGQAVGFEDDERVTPASVLRDFNIPLSRPLDSGVHRSRDW